MALKADEVIVIATGAGVLLFWLILASTLSTFRSQSVSLLILLVLGSLGVVFYGIHEDKSNLWWIIPTVVICLCLIGVVYLVTRRSNSSIQPQTLTNPLANSVVSGEVEFENLPELYLKMKNPQKREEFGDQLNAKFPGSYTETPFGSYTESHPHYEESALFLEGKQFSIWNAEEKLYQKIEFDDGGDKIITLILPMRLEKGYPS